MANLPKPKVLPKVTYAPPSEGPGPGDVGRAVRDASGAVGQFMGGLAQGAYGAGTDFLSGLFSEPKVARYDYGQPKVAYPDTPIGPNAPTAPWGNNTNFGVPGGINSVRDTMQGLGTGLGQNSPGGAPIGPPSPTKDQWDMVNKGGVGAPGTGNVAGPPSPTEQDWAKAEADQNARRQQAAAKAGNDAEVARLQAEWDRLAKTPVFKAMYGSADPFSIQKRLVDVYMNPNDRNPGYDFESAASNMIADDVWAEAFRMATGRAPNDVEWVDHNVGRDPLEGHPEAIQYMQQRAADLARQNQIGAQQTYQMLLDKNGNIMS